MISISEHLHIMGIAGSGASAFASLARAFGYRVSGCDRGQAGHSPRHLRGVDWLIVSPAIFSLDPENPELVAAYRRGIPVATWQEFLGKFLLKGRQVIGVCGTHGKSTIAAMIAYVLEGAGFDPSYLLGAKIRGGSNFRRGGSKLFVIEADEFNNNFLNYPVSLSVCVSLEFDHPECFSNFEEYLSSFETFARGGEKFVCYKRDRGVRRFLGYLKGWPGKVRRFSMPYQGELLVPGGHNRINARAAYLAVRDVGVSAAEAGKLLGSFPGVERRLELRKVIRGRKIYDDYGHHPGQLRAVSTSLRQLYPDEVIVVVFQPHMFSRTKILFDEFVSVLREMPVNEVLVTDIFPSREKDLGKIHSRDLVRAVGRDTVRYLPQEEILAFLKKAPSNVVAFVSAGDVNKLIDEL